MMRAGFVRPYKGVFPVVPTIFHADGSLDKDGQRRALDFMIDAGSNGLCILANFSEQFVLADDEREMLMRLCLEHVARRIPVIVTTTHTSPRVTAERSKRAQDMGASMVMVMPPYHGATFRFSEQAVFDFFKTVSDAIAIPVMVQDAPAAGTPMSAAFLARMAKEIDNLSYFKIETAQAAQKLRDMIALGGTAIEGPWDGEEAITLMADLDAGATGSMTGGGYPDLIRTIIDPYLSGDRASAKAAYNSVLPLINYENRQTGIATAKILMKAGGIIKCDALRAPQRDPSEHAKAGLLELARELDVMALRWGR